LARTDQGYINHVALVLDESGSMAMLSDQVVKVADGRVADLARISKERDQETRMSVYLFSADSYARGYGSTIDCIFYDKDVLRFPSLKGKYQPNGQTPLLDATLKAIEDLEQTATLYGNHAFLLFIVTDGEENNSTQGAEYRLREKLRSLPEQWTIAVLVPTQRARQFAEKFGFASGNIEQWDATKEGIQRLGERMSVVTDAYMQARTQGMRGTKNLFELDVKNLTPQNVQKAWVKAPVDTYQVFTVPQFTLEQMAERQHEISKFVRSQTGNYKARTAYYQLTKTEDDIRSTTPVVLRNKVSGDVFLGIGQDARKILGLPDQTTRVRPADHPDFDIFFRSGSHNRKLVPGTDLIVFP
jgi:hypothetical protein